MRLLALAAALAIATPLSFAQEPLRPVKPRARKPAAEPEKARPGVRKGVLPAPKKRSATARRGTRKPANRAGGTPPRVQLPAAGVPSQKELEREALRMMEEMRRDMERQMGKGVGTLPGKSSQRSSSSHTRRVVVVNGETVVDEETRDGKPVRRGGARRAPRKGSGAGAPVRADARAEASATSSASSNSSDSATDSSSSQQRSSGNRGARKGTATKGRPVGGKRAPAARGREPSTKAPARPRAPRGRRG